MNKEEFLDRLKERSGTSTRSEAERQTRAVLAVLGEQISREEGLDLASQLPKEFHDVVVRQLGSSMQRGKMDKAYFVGQVRTALGSDETRDAEQVTRDVLHVLGEAVSRGEIEDILREIPVELREAVVVQ